MEAAIGCMSLAAVAFLARQCLCIRRRAAQPYQQYQDEDGVATKDSAASSQKGTTAKLFMNAAAAVGTSTSVLSNAGHRARTGQWSLVATSSRISIWLLLAVQILATSNEASIHERYKKGPILLISVSLSSHALEAGHLSPSLAFASIGLFRNLHAVMQELPAMLASLQESYAASRRVENYLQRGTEKQNTNRTDLTLFENVHVSWPNPSSASGPSGSSFSLKNVSLQFPKGKLSIITGKSSSGKGLLLSALLGEANVELGGFNASRESVSEEQKEPSSPDLAYVSQPPWIENRTIRQNIVFGNLFDEDRYMAVLHACALERDLEALPHGDLTIAGVNGGSLSGGQKWRVSLARALYSRARTLVLDDVLSAVDPHVAKWLCLNALSDTSGVDAEDPAISRRSVLQTFSIYLLGGGVWPVSVAVLTTFLCRLLGAGNSWWLTKWTANKELDSMSLRFNLCIYLALSVCAAIAVAVHSIAVQGVSRSASEALFRRTVHGVLHSPLRWIDKVSLGKLLQGLASDMYLVDHRVAAGLSDLLRIIMQLILVILTSGAATPQTIAMMVVMLSFYFKITERHLRMSKRLNRLIPLAAQPILEHTNSTVSGIMTIRAFKKESMYVERMYDLLDVEMALSWHITLGQRWIHGRYGILGSLFVCAITVSLVLADADAATAGFAINVALLVKATMSGMMGKINMLTSGARAIDRILDIANAPAESQDGEDVASSWPASGKVDVQDITVRYDPGLPPVLTGISFSIAPRERLGVVGRTGAGKTSLTNSLLRFIDTEAGAIHIDGVDIATIELARLRSSISLIPQDPFLFSGTLRSNLNIHVHRSDEDMKVALRKVAFPAKDGKMTVDALDDLDMTIQPGGENLSHGQRQMVCLARAILYPRRIVILDEATSAVDRATDSMVQEVIRRELEDSTVIIVAHRLATVADLDKVLVLDEGAAVEFGSPADLMQNKGVFWGMVNQSGDARHVREAIKRARTM
ncbi:hypothetical protein V2A60_001796 [Cordyceps javanica]|uniref:ABC bile acid transporter n=1 Tax=Cordyceps javanica TaxID=43265 RepID=A0A545WD99_9HYPO|nr:ABC bile acid transporter [Cordyceps javanica]TQW11926.1 ABC bile acid transporter [Cordyceps javanica]